MATIKLGGNDIETVGSLPNIGDKAPDFDLTAQDLSSKKIADYKGSRVVMNIFPSIDTNVCATSVRKFNERATSLKNTKVLSISKDLPFALNGFPTILKLTMLLTSPIFAMEISERIMALKSLQVL